MFPYDCAGYEDWAFAPFYGPTGGPSGATLPPYQPTLTQAPDGRSSAGRAYPGKGGINAPGVPAGPNSGMGPVHASREMISLPQLTEWLNMLNHQIRTIPSFVNPAEQERIATVLEREIKSAAVGCIGDLVHDEDVTWEEAGYMERMLDEMMEKCREVLTRRCPWVNRLKRESRQCGPDLETGGI